ncbi:MAG: hypothetical protein DMG12_14085 [Acidobacteria bacterium]|nr:MAG: hypothetical protein DMG12_14085 [Acidobacteriota bacterium]
MSPWNVVVPAVAGAGLCAWGALHPRSQLFGPTLRNAGSGCALTFDDGPNPDVTPYVLSLLEKYRVPATHPSLLLFTRQRIIDELNRCEDAIIEATGRRTTRVRPPFGFRGPQFDSAARRAGFSKVVMWSVNAWDWNPQDPSSVGRRMRKVTRGDIVLLHDGDHRTSKADRRHMLQALEFWLPRWKDSGLEFVAC